jgi:Flp pilus assembly protein TadB
VVDLVSRGVFLGDLFAKRRLFLFMTDELKSLEKERERMVTRIFWLGLEIAAIFAIPAVLAFVFGRKLPGNGVYFLLLGTFVLSWMVTIARWRKISKKAKHLDEKIRELKRGE